MIKIKYLLPILSLFLFACKKEQLLNNNPVKAVQLNIKGLVLTDTLEFTLNDKNIGEAINNEFKLNVSLFNSRDQIQVRKKNDHKAVSTISLSENPFNQTKRIFYDGVTFSDNVAITPVKNPENMGFRLRFTTTFIDFYGGSVDVEFFDEYIDYDKFEFVYKPLNKVIKNVSGAFSDFTELPPLEPDHQYYFKVYKSGTKDLPYKSSEHVFITDPENNYGQFVPFAKGDSQLISIMPNGDANSVTDYYQTADLSADFK